MNLQKQKERVWWREVLRLQKIVATLLLISFSAGLVHSDIDLDGIPDAVDPFPETVAQDPKILSPIEDEVIYAPSREVTFTGTAETGSQIKLFEDGIPAELSCQEAGAEDVEGTGLLLSKTTGGSNVDQVSLLAGTSSVSQALYNTNTDSAPTTWRISPTASWATEQLDDAIDEICDYQAGGSPDDRCGSVNFPEQVIVIATATRVYLFDAQLKTFWKSILVTGATSVAAENGKVFVGTATGVLVWDFAGDDFTKTFTSELPSGAVVSLDTVSVGATQYLLVATAGGTAAINLSTDAVLTSVDTGTLVGAAFTSSNRILWATATEVQISDDPIDTLVDNWVSTDISSTARFPFVSPGTVTAVASDLIGLTTGVARVFDDGNGKYLIQHVTQTSATLPMGISTQGHWLSADAVEALDVSSAAKDLDNVLTVTSVPAATGTDLDIFEFGGANRYLKSKNITDFSVSGDTVTVGAWVRRPDFGGTGPFKKILSHGDGAALGEWDYWLSAGENFFGYGLEADPYFFGLRSTEGEKGASAFTFALDTWQLLVGTYDGSEGSLRIYLDGEEQDQNLLLPGVNPIPLSGDIATVNKELRLGWGYDLEYFNGDMALPFVSTEAYSAEQVALLYRYSNGWFSENTTTTLRGTSDSVVDVTCDTAHKECFVLTDDGTVTRIDGNLFSGGVTSAVGGVTDVSEITPTYLGTWQCTHSFDTSGLYSVFARTYWEGAPTAIDSELRNFTVFSQAEQTLTTPTIVAFPDTFTAQDFATVLWRTDETDQDFFVAQIATEPTFQVGVRQQVVQGHSARFDALDDSQQYYFRAKARNHAGGVSAWSDAATVTIDILAPAGGVVENVDGRISSLESVNFSWEKTPFSDIGSGIVWYELEVSKDQTFVDEAERVYTNDRLEAASYEFLDEEQGGTYFARVRAMDAVGNWSGWITSSGTLIDKTAPEAFALSSLSTTAGGDVRLRWASSSDAETGIISYEVWQKEDAGAFVLLSTESSEKRSYGVSGLQDGRTYTFKIIAKNEADLSTETAEQSILIDAAQLAAPQWLTSSYSTSTSVSLEWSSDKDLALATEYQIFRNGTLLDTVDIGATTFTDPDTHVSGEVFVYQVRSIISLPLEILGGFSADLRVLIDTAEPAYDTSEVIGPAPIDTWRNKNFSFQVWGTDGTPLFDPETSTGSGFSSGIDNNFYREGAVDPFVPHAVPILITESGSHDFQFQFRDYAGNENTPPQDIANVKLDKVAPTAAITQTTLSEEIFEAQNGFVSTGTLGFQITAQDSDSGIDTYEISYRVDKNGDGFFRSGDGDTEWSAWSTVTATGNISVPADGVLEMRTAVTDLAGNRTISEAFAAKIDRQAPQISADATDQIIVEDITIQIDGADVPVEASGIDTVYYTKNGDDPKAAIFPIRREGTTVVVEVATDAPGGLFTIKYYATDIAGNESEIHIVTNDIIDSDSDGLPDWWEDLYGGSVAPTSDTDTDGLTAEQEYAAHTDPTEEDTDGDGALDGTETSSGTDPLNGMDHAFQWVSPEEASTIKSSFTILGTATPEAVAEVYDTITSALLGIATVDPQGRFAMEISGVAEGDYALKVQFQHPNNPLAIVESEIRNITVDAAGATQPAISNISDADEVGPETSRVLVSSVTAGADIELFEILDNVVYSLGTVVATAEGTADIWLPHRAETRQLFVIDHATWKTSEIINFEQGLFIEGIIFDEDGVVIDGATIELTDSQESSTSVQSIGDGTYQVFARPNQTYTFRVEAVDHFPEQQQVITAFDDIQLNTTLLQVDREVATSGVVSDSEGTLLGGVAVRLTVDAIDLSTTTAANGTYSLNVPASKTYAATFILADHNTHAQAIVVSRDDVEVNVTLVEQDVAVLVSGKVLEVGTNVPLSGVVARFVSDQAETFETQTGETGDFSLSLRRDRGYTVTYTLANYTEVIQTFPLEAAPLVLPNIQLSPIERVTSSSVKGWSGRRLDDPADAISDIWTPSMTYEESMEQVRRLNSGISGQVIVREKDGIEEFAGYISGRISIDNFLVADDSQTLGISAFGDRVQALHASAKIGHCLAFRDTTMEFRDVSARSRWYPSVAKIHSLGQMPLDKEYKFRPTKMLSWETALEMAFAVRCMEADAFELLQSFRQDQWETLPLQNTIAVRRAYTALDMGWVSLEQDLTKQPTREQLLRLWVEVFEVPVDPLATKTSFQDIDSDNVLAPMLVVARKLDLIPSSKNFRPGSSIPRSEAAEWFLSFFEAEQNDRIDRTAQEYQFDDHKVATGREVTEDEQVRMALLQKEVAEARRQRIADIVPMADDLDIEGKSGFIRRKGEDRTDFLNRLAAAKEATGIDPTKILLDYESLREKSLANRGIVEREVVSKIQTFDMSGFIRRQGEGREEFLARLNSAKKELEEKKIALNGAPVSMKASAPKVAGPIFPTQNLGKLKIEIDTDKMCDIKMNWETTETFRDRCGNIREIEKVSFYQKIFDSFRKRPGIQKVTEPVEVTIKSAEPNKDAPTLERSRMDVIFRRANPEVELEEQTAKIKTRRSLLGL